MLNLIHDFLHAHPVALIVLILGLCSGAFLSLINNAPIGKQTDKGYQSYQETGEGDPRKS